MAEQVLIQFRADKLLKQQVTEIYESLGMDLPTAFRMFMKRSILERGLPFDARLPEEAVIKSDDADTSFEEKRQYPDALEMSLEEINAEMEDMKADRRAERRLKDF